MLSLGCRVWWCLFISNQALSAARRRCRDRLIDRVDIIELSQSELPPAPAGERCRLMALLDYLVQTNYLNAAQLHTDIRSKTPTFVQFHHPSRRIFTNTEIVMLNILLGEQALSSGSIYYNFHEYCERDGRSPSRCNLDRLPLPSRGSAQQPNVVVGAVQLRGGGSVGSLR